MAKLEEKLKNLPAGPGVYFFKDAAGQIIYIGKAAVLKNRVGSYFQKSKQHDPKTLLLIDDIADLDWITVGSEVEALFLESEFIKRYKPRYNIDLRDDKHWNYVKITTQDKWPVVSFVRRPADDKASYFGPFSEGLALKRAMKFLRRAFPYVTHETLPARGCLQYHLGLCPGPEEGAVTPAEYRRVLRQLMMYLSGQGEKLIRQLERQMAKAAKDNNFEEAARLRDQVRDLKALSRQMIFGDKESFDLSRDQALTGLADRLGLPRAPRRIEAYDISHIQGSHNTASMVVFTDGVPNKDQYRRFKMRRGGNDDFAHMREVITRRFSGKNLEGWPLPDLIIIDGGKGQLAAALSILEEKAIGIPAVGLAKREEELILPAIANEAKQSGNDPDSKREYQIIRLPRDSHILKLLQRVRDEAHRFAVSYHSLLRGKAQTRSALDDIPGVGPATRKKLVKNFGSVRGVRQAPENELSDLVGPAKAKIIREYLA